MFSLCAESPELAESDLYHLCASLNAPVVNLDGLPAGPARAAIVLHATRSEGGSRLPQLSVGFRLLATGQVAVYRYSGVVRELGSASRAMDTALSFVEAMGFLFDEDLVGDHAGGGRAVAFALWQKLVGPEELGGDTLAGFEGVSDTGDLNPQLPDLAEVKLDEPEYVEKLDSVPVAVATGQAADDVAATSPTAPAVPFHETSAEVGPAEARDSGLRTGSTDEEHAVPNPVAAVTGTGGSKLGRVPIVRMRVKSDGTGSGDGKRERRLRLLGSF